MGQKVILQTSNGPIEVDAEEARSKLFGFGMLPQPAMMMGPPPVSGLRVAADAIDTVTGVVRKSRLNDLSEYVSARRYEVGQADATLNERIAALETACVGKADNDPSVLALKALKAADAKTERMQDVSAAQADLDRAQNQGEDWRAISGGARLADDFGFFGGGGFAPGMGGGGMGGSGFVPGLVLGGAAGYMVADSNDHNYRWSPYYGYATPRIPAAGTGGGYYPR